MVKGFKVIRCVYHRNGISGIGFYAVWFSYEGDDGEKEEAVATVSSDDLNRSVEGEAYNPETRILALDEVGGVDLERTMRGDCFHQTLVDYIRKEFKHA